MAERGLVVGLGASGEAVARHLLARQVHVVAVDDAPGDRGRQTARRLGIDLVVPSPGVPASHPVFRLAGADLVVPSPGVPASHPVFGLAAARGVAVRAEV
ncbi:MAG: UDP-N-acetylmuramoyl-L-alanine--D-glutamate ligase, partial [Actinomycetota bacterium]|nr:UDP-N-acetylmuramoyl-L-alanine--D-glutamate ligase [Actinomycetota bacterium]